MASLYARLLFVFYRYRFLALYILYGALSLLLEMFIREALISYSVNRWVASVAGVGTGIFFAFYMNVKFNFHIVKSKRRLALMYFAGISLCAFTLQFFIRKFLLSTWGISFEVSRFLIAGALFFVSYWLHRMITFKEYKKVGVAIYADGVEDIEKIYTRISNVCDFIHIDIVDRSFNPDCSITKAYRAEVVRAYWRKKPVDVHVMSRTPGQWLEDICPFVDVVYIHLDIDEDVGEVLQKIREAGCQPGIAVSMSESFDDIFKYLDQVENVLILSIPKPGFSGQKFDADALERIARLEEYPRRSSLEVCVDGGVNQSTVGILNVDKVVSGSFVLQAKNPVRQIILLQTSGEYHGD